MILAVVELCGISLLLVHVNLLNLWWYSFVDNLPRSPELPSEVKRGSTAYTFPSICSGSSSGKPRCAVLSMSHTGSLKRQFICYACGCSVLLAQGGLELNVSEDGVIFTEADKAGVISTRHVETAVSV